MAAPVSVSVLPLQSDADDGVALTEVGAAVQFGATVPVKYMSLAAVLAKS